MDFSLSHEQKMLIDTVRKFIDRELRPHEEFVETNDLITTEMAQAIYAKSKALGLYALNMPSEFGGGGLNTVDTMLCEEQFGHTSDVLIRRAFGDVYDVLLLCTGEQVERWLKPVVSGTRTCALAITETGAGSDARAIKTKARPSHSGWLLTGSKQFISDAEFADCFLVLARTDEKEISLFIVDRGAPGITVGRNQQMMGLRGTSHNELYFDDVPLESVALLGERGQGFKIILEMLGRVRLAFIGARAVGKATHVMELMVRHANERKQFGRSIGEFQMIQLMLADSAMEINAARLMVLHTAWMIDAGLDARDWISMVKVQASEMLGRIVDRAVQVFGGMGFCKDLAIERYYRDARVFRIFDGTSEIHRMTLAKSLLRHGASLFDIHR